ncbi:hypothetical protein [Cryobacterium sp. BB736]|uniref:hypothetical protein n=1 Tax=Cryobacterium sp. BB736 TaxID=2746963 RepID=UPI001876C466|nr:hypothetical protein [Cryobacterium sp. BB736]
MVSFRFSTLTGELRSKESPLRQHLVERFPNASALTNVYAADIGPLLVEGGDANAGTVGTAFDVMTRLLLDITHRPTPFPRTRMWTEQHEKVSARLAAAAVGALKSTPESDDDFYRACWGLALLTETYRSIQAWGTSPINFIIYEQDGDMAAILALAPDAGLRQLEELRRLANVKLYSQLATPLVLSPTFYASALLKADADLVAGGTLIDLKVKLGARNRNGERPDALATSAIYQLLGYLFMDTEDEYGIHDIGIYSARYGRLATWPVDEALDKLAGHPVQLDVERQELLWLLQENY